MYGYILPSPNTQQYMKVSRMCKHLKFDTANSMFDFSSYTLSLDSLYP